MPLRKAIILATTLSLMLFPAIVRAQDESDSDSLVRLDYARTAELIEIDGQNVRKVIGPAEFMHNNTYMLCDTALWNIDTQVIDAIGHVSIIQEGTVLTSDKMVYLVDQDLARFRGHVVQLEDSDHNILRTSYLDYNTKDSVAVFDFGGSMRDKDGQLVESIRGTYDAKAKLFTFKDDVNMFTDSIFVKTTYLEYRSDLDKATFGRDTDAWKEDNMLSADAGWYDRRREVFFFRNNVHVMNDTQEGWSDTLYFYRNTMNVDMRGRVQVTDTSRNVTGVAGRMVYVDSASRVTMLRDPAVVGRMEQEGGKVDSVYFGADTIIYYTLRMCDVDSVVVENAKKRLEEIDVDPVGTYRAQAAEAARKAAEEALKNDPNYRPPEDEGGIGPGGGPPGMPGGGPGGGERGGGPQGKPGEGPQGPPPDKGEGPPEGGPGPRELTERRDSLGAAMDSLGVGVDSLLSVRDSLGIGVDSLGVGGDSLNVAMDSLGVAVDSLGVAVDSLNSAMDSLGVRVDSLLSVGDSLGAGLDSLLSVRDSLGVGLDSLMSIADSLGIGLDSLLFLRDSLGVDLDSLGVGLDSLGVAADSLAGPLDTTKVGFVWASGNVRLYKEDMQVVCDSLEYCDLDSLVRMYRGTLIWNEVSQQYSADSVFSVVRNGVMEKSSLMSEAYIIIEEDPGKFYDQIKSVEALAFFGDGGELSRFDALGSATGAFFLREQDVVATANKTDSKMLSATFKEGSLNKVYYFEDVKSDAYPVVQLAEEERTFKGFSWQPERRPADRYAVTTAKIRPAARGRYTSKPRAAFDQTEIYFPGYIPGIYLEIAQRDSLERVRAHERRVMRELEERMLADSLARAEEAALVDLAAEVDSLVTADLEVVLDSLARTDSLAVGDGLVAVSDSLGRADSLAVKDSLAAAGSGGEVEVKGPTKEELKAKALAEKEKARAEREAERQRKIEEREEKWAMMDSLDAAKVAAKQARKDEKARQKKRRSLEKMEKINASEDAKLENYVDRIARQEERRAEKGKPSKYDESMLNEDGAQQSYGWGGNKAKAAEQYHRKLDRERARKRAKAERAAAKAARKAGIVVSDEEVGGDVVSGDEVVGDVPDETTGEVPVEASEDGSVEIQEVVPDEAGEM